MQATTRVIRNDVMGYGMNTSHIMYYPPVQQGALTSSSATTPNPTFAISSLHSFAVRPCENGPTLRVIRNTQH
eukprot:3175745-Pyramimonas_sp.AAC.1